MNHSFDNMSLDSKLKILRYLAFGCDTYGDMHPIEIAIAEDILKARISDPYYLPDELNIKDEIKLNIKSNNSKRRKWAGCSADKSKHDILRFLAFGFDYFGNMRSNDIATAKTILEQRSEYKLPNFLPDYLHICA